jgi:hypothetical protein
LPTDQAMKFMETATDFFVWPAMFLRGLLVMDWRARIEQSALPRQETHAETLSCPERKHDVVAEKQTGFRGSAVVGNGHQDDGADITPTHG